MSMLAEKKRKQKWSLNPRGNQWSQDANKFGQKMLEKMGWSKGKGLGANLDGITEHIRISQKSDNTGIGFKDDETWTSHESNFNALLQNLSSNDTKNNDSSTNDNTDIKLTSLEKKSEKSRRRVHYHKFLRSKDLSRYSDKDLANIFGKKTLKEENKVTNEETEEKIEDAVYSDEKTSDFGVQTHNRGSMVEYFSKKLKRLHGGDSKNQRISKDSESELETRLGFGFSESNGDLDNFGTPTKRSNNKIKNMNEDTSERILEDSQTSAECVKTPKKRKKNTTEEISAESAKKKKRREDLESKGIVNPVFDPLHSATKITKHILTTINEDEETCAESSKDTTVDSLVLTENLEDTRTCESADQSLEKRKSKSQKKKKTIKFEGCVDNPGFDINSSFDIPVNATFQVKRNKKQMVSLNVEEQSSNPNGKKIGKNVIADTTFTINDSLKRENGYSEDTFTIEDKVKGKKSSGFDNPSLYLDASINADDGKNVDKSQNFEVKRKKKKGVLEAAIEQASAISDKCESSKRKSKKQKKNWPENVGLDNPGLDTNNSLCGSVFEENIETSNNSLDNKVRNKKKTKFNGVDNPCLNAGDSSCDTDKEKSIKFDPFEVKPKKKKRKLDETEREVGLDNPCLNLSDNIDNTIEDSVKLENSYSNYEVKQKTKKKISNIGLDNPALNLNVSDELEEEINNSAINNNKMETPRKNKKKNRHEKCFESSQDSNLENSIENITNNARKNKKKKGNKENIEEVMGTSQNSNLENDIESSKEIITNIDKKNKKKARSNENINGIINPSLNLSASDFEDSNALEENKKTKKNKNKQTINGIVNPSLNLDNRDEKISAGSSDISENSVDVKKRNKKKKNRNLDLAEHSNDSIGQIETTEKTDELFGDIMLNVTATPLPEKNPETDMSSKERRRLQRRKSVRFSDVNEERIIPIKYKDPLITPSKGVENENFNENNNLIEENINSMSQAFDQFEAEVENDINEAKLMECEVMVGEVGDPNGENQLLPNGETKLKLKYAKFQKSPSWVNRRTDSHAKKAYKHLIKGDITLSFKNTNLHLIQGYSVR